jgi:hypothetical protein
LGEVHVLHLDRTTTGQLMIQMLPSAAKWLPSSLGFSSQAVTKRAGRLGQ